MMTKKISVWICSLLLCFFILLPSSAAEMDGFADEYERLQDMAGLLTDDEAAYLTDMLNEISVRQEMEVVIATTDALYGKSVAEYADDLYDECHFGYGEDRDGLLLLISMEDRDWYISTCGYGITAFTDAGLDYIGQQIVPALSEGEYAEAFEEYIVLCDAFITQAMDGEPYDTDNMPRGPLSPVWILISLLAGLIIAACVVWSMVQKLKSVSPQKSASGYIKDGSLNITEQHDLFLYHTVTRKARPKQSSSSGSSVHRSSSGSSHGGRGGKF